MEYYHPEEDQAIKISFNHTLKKSDDFTFKQYNTSFPLFIRTSSRNKKKDYRHDKTSERWFVRDINYGKYNQQFKNKGYLCNLNDRSILQKVFLACGL